MKIIFLDIEGTLKSINDYAESHLSGSLFYPVEFSREKFNLNEECINLIKQLIDDNTKIVISSSERIGSCLKHFHKMFQLYGWNTENIIIDFTPICKNSSRGYEIKEWLKTHSIENYIILDDCLDDELCNDSHFIHVDNSSGIDVTNCNKAKDILENISSI